MSDQNFDNMTSIEISAAKQTDKAFERNKKFWDKQHKRQFRLYESVRNFDRKQDDDKKTSSYNRTYADPATTSYRSNIQIGTMWMLHNTANSIIGQALFEGDELMELEARRGQQVEMLTEMGEYIEDLFTDDIPNIKGTFKDGNWDIVATGCTVITPSWQSIIKRIRRKNEQGQHIEVEVDLGEFPVFNEWAPWDTYPTADATDPKKVHEWILETSMTVQELREWEQQGLIENVDEVLEALKREGKPVSPDKEKRPRTGPDDKTNEDTGNQIEVLISYTLFALYENEEFFDNAGRDRSKEEVECLIIKAKNANPIMHLDRNPFSSQEKPVIVGGWYHIPGELYPISPFEIAEKLIQHYEDLFNLIQDGANQDIYLTEIVPAEGIDEAELGYGGPARRIHSPNKDMADGVIPQYMKRPATVLGELYNQRDFTNHQIEIVTTIVAMVRGETPEGEKATATEINVLEQRVTTLFEQSAKEIEDSLMKPMWEWMIIMLAEFSDDQKIAQAMNMVITVGPDGETPLPEPIYFNPFKQFMPVIPNPLFKIKLNGALRAAQSRANQAMLLSAIEIGKDMEPFPDPDNDDKVTAVNIGAMYFDWLKLSRLGDTDKYKFEVPPEVLAIEEEVEGGEV